MSDELFSNFWDKCAQPETLPSAEPRFEERIIAGVTACEPTDLFTDLLYETLGASELVFEGVTSDSFAPIPMYSIKSDHPRLDQFVLFLKKVMTCEAQLRVVVAIGKVKYGLISSRHQFSYGSIGCVMSTVLYGCMNLNIDKSWMDEKLCDVFPFNYEEFRSLNGKDFYAIEAS